MLGVVLPDITNPFFAEYARALEVRAAAYGYVFVIANSDANEDHESRIVSDLTNRHVDGLLIGTAFPPSAFGPMTLPGRPIVLIDRSVLPIPGYAAVGANFREGARVLVSISSPFMATNQSPLITGGEWSSTREQGWGDAFQSHGLPLGPIMRTNFSYGGGYEATRRLLNWPTPPRANLPRRISWASARSGQFPGRIALS